ncbi:virB8 family protein [Psychrobacter sp. TWP2-1-2]|uniref:virB8 family protein n=1 Tax=Psychrobacter sp. TWP2-1-2 TaxID=2804623 RepID=UPI003CF36C9F
MKFFNKKTKSEQNVVKQNKPDLTKNEPDLTEDKPKKDGKISKKVASQAFIDASLAFENTRIDEILKREKTWQKITGASMITSVVMAIAIMFLTPLKEVEPYLVRVDNNTGQTDIVTVLANSKSDYGEEVSKFFASNYVRLVEGYDWYTIQSSFNKALLFSSEEEQNRLNNRFASSNAPHKVYQKRNRVEIQIDNVSFIDENLLQVRFTKTIVNADGGSYNPQNGGVTPAPIVSQGIATLGYDYINVPQLDEVRLINPLGFTVYTYRVDEVMNAAPAPIAAPVAEAAPVTGGF